ncbi:D-alanine--D-alanine ligase [Alicyclobacillus contaminans]|uniref:D-alanine--D-alanine ligase n=1 Tax=Alicyclobacillus contaminans TaxID=392016 RepID=UPI00041A6337|nr:D-alanine--D-alanine ligase [Alicyclobacillus contaminans]GMA51205.1 D-alanine--D-alanine ligase [Alicyclobacillus contaminans]
MNRKIRVGVIFGGKSGEHEVSIQSATSIMNALSPDKFEVVPMGIRRSGTWIVGPTALPALMAEAQIALGAPAEGAESAANAEGTAAGGELVRRDTAGSLVPPDFSAQVDVVIPVLHGPNGEDGTMQGLLEVLDVPYVGAGVLASAVGMDKVVMKQLFAQAGLPQVRYRHYLRRAWEEEPEAVLADIRDNLGFPCFVKPANMGSSVGISKVKDETQLNAAVQLAARYDRKILVEQGLDVREVEVAVLGNDHPVASVVGEIIPSNEFYDYHAKYVDGASTLVIPANLPDAVANEVRRLAVRAFQAVDCSGLARVDFFVEKATQRVLVNEINTMPGFTRYSMYPKLWEATGLSYSALIERLIHLALERHREKQKSSQDLSLPTPDM